MQQDGQLPLLELAAEMTHWALIRSTPRTLRPTGGARTCCVFIALAAKPQLVRQPQRCTENQAGPCYGKPTLIDGIAETWSDDAEAQAKMTASPEAQTWFADGAKFIGHIKSYRAEETVFIKPVRGPAPVVKAISFIVRKAGYSHEAFLHHWMDIRGTMARDVPGLRGFVLSRIIAEPTRPDVPTMEITPTIDGIAETWFDSADARTAMAQTPEARRWFLDGGLFIGQITTYLTTEQIVIPPPSGP
jgi:uncharacterized protein (TIGR02118 family)